MSEQASEREREREKERERERNRDRRDRDREILGLKALKDFQLLIADVSENDGNYIGRERRFVH